MTKTTIIGRLADRDGLATKETFEGVTGPSGRLVAYARTDHYAVPAMEYRSRQPKRIPLDLDHGRDIGRVLHLEHANDALWLVAEVDDPELVPVEARFLSASVLMDRDGSDVEIQAVALTADPASVGALPVHELAGDIRQACRQSWRLRNRFLSTLLEHARDTKVGTTLIADDRPDIELRNRPVVIGVRR